MCLLPLHSDEALPILRSQELDTGQEFGLQDTMELGVWTEEESSQSVVPMLAAGEVRVYLRGAHCQDVALEEEGRACEVVYYTCMKINGIAGVSCMKW